MTKNVGSTEKLIRLIVAAIALAAYFFLELEGIIGYAALAVAGLALVTGLLNFCPLWTVFGINTTEKK